MQVVELQAQLVEARDLHGALRAKLAETERTLKRTEHGGADGANAEYLKNIILQLFLLEEGMEKLLPVIATFLQFSPQELERIREARANFGGGGGGGGGGGAAGGRTGGGGGGGLFGSLGEEWLFGADPAAEAEARKGAAHARAAAGGRELRPRAAARTAEEAEGGAWSELERSWRKTARLKQLLAAANAHMESGQAQLRLREREVAALRRRLLEAGSAAEDIVMAEAAADGDGDAHAGHVAAASGGGAGEGGGVDAAPAGAPRAAVRTRPAEVAAAAAFLCTSAPEAAAWTAFADARSPMPHASAAAASTGAAATALKSTPGAAARRAPPARKGAVVGELSEAEREAERALERELAADAEARSALQAAIKAREPSALRAGLDVMAERGLDCDDVLVDDANRLLAELQG